MYKFIQKDGKSSRLYYYNYASKSVLSIYELSGTHISKRHYYFALLALFTVHLLGLFKKAFSGEITTDRGGYAILFFSISLGFSVLRIIAKLIQLRKMSRLEKYDEVVSPLTMCGKQTVNIIEFFINLILLFLVITLLYHITLASDIVFLFLIYAYVFDKVLYTLVLDNPFGKISLPESI